MKLCPHHTKDLDWTKCTVGFHGCRIETVRLRAAQEPKARAHVKIPPDVQALQVSRQRKLQIAWKRLKLCILCGRARDPNNATYCPDHAVKHRENQRKVNGASTRYLNAASYQTEFEQQEQNQKRRKAVMSYTVSCVCSRFEHAYKTQKLAEDAAMGHMMDEGEGHVVTCTRPAHFHPGGVPVIVFIGNPSKHPMVMSY